MWREYDADKNNAHTVSTNNTASSGYSAVHYSAVNSST